MRHNGTSGRKASTTEPTGAGRLAGGRFVGKTWKNTGQNIHRGLDPFLEDLWSISGEGKERDTMSLVSSGITGYS